MTTPSLLSDVVSAALLRLGGDTLAARLARPLLEQPSLATASLAGRLIDRLPGDPDGRAARLARARERAATALTETTRLGLTVLSPADRGAYPPWLWQIPDPPIALWVGGDVTALEGPAVAVVGSRHATPVGLAMAGQLGRALAEAGLTVVSGLARGVDAAAHRGALEAGGRTVAVLGSGLDTIYPGEHLSLAKDLQRRGALVSEYPPGTPPLPGHFPLRNRIISGLSRAVVVVEASERSGSLITAKAAVEQGRDVLAVPGNPASGCYRGSHALIKDGARLVETVEDILQEIGWAAPGRPPGEKSPKVWEESGLSDALPPGDAATADELSLRTGRPAAAILAALARLELAGAVQRLPGGCFARLD